MKTKLPVGYALPLVLLLSMLVSGAPASAHRLDEYLQATTISVEEGRIRAQLRLTPGVAVFPRVRALLDTNADGVLSAGEQRTYAEAVLRDVSITLDGERLRPTLVSWKYAPRAEMKEGRGEIQLDFNVEAKRSQRNHRLSFENHHQSQIAVYLVNCLVPSTPNLQVTGQQRNYQQSVYQLDYMDLASAASPSGSAPHSGRHAWLAAAGLLLLLPLAWGFWHARARKNATAQSEAQASQQPKPLGGREK